MIKIRDTLNEIISEIEDDTIYLLLSSGLDSQSLLFSALELNKKVVVVSFTRVDYKSRDFKAAKSIAERLNLEFLPIYLPTKTKDIANYALILAKKYKCRTKTEFECTFPMIFVYKKISNHAKKKATIVSGLGADCYYVLSKKGMLHYKSKPDEFRSMTYEKENYCQINQHDILKSEFNLEHIVPYLDKRVFNLFYGKTWDECNKPKQKSHVREQYKKDLIPNHYFNHTNYQLGDSGIADLFSSLLDTNWNTKNWKSVTGIYNAVVKGEISSSKNI
jgi:asparagine synthetase B (glutamine-hydrolysing)